MATVTKGGTLADTGVTKNDVYALVDSATVTAIVNADVAAGAAIVDTKLAQITTASKVSGAAVTSLASLPAGAGVVPVANLGTGTPTSSTWLNGAGAWVGGGVVQVVNAMYSAVDTTADLTTIDDSIPQVDEGKEFMALSITPKSATNKLKITVCVYGSHSATTAVVAHLHQDDGADAIAVSAQDCRAAGASVCIKFVHYMTAGTTSATEFEVLAGGSNAGTFSFNGVAGGRIFGGKAASSITIEEIGV